MQAGVAFLMMSKFGDINTNHSAKDKEINISQQKPVVFSLWSLIAAVSAAIMLLLSLPLLAISNRFLTTIRYRPESITKGIWSLDLYILVFILIATLLLIASGVATIGFLKLRSARSHQVAVISLLLTLIGLGAIAAVSIPLATEGERMGGDTGPLQFMLAILIGVVLPALIGFPCFLALLSLWRLKRTIPEKQ